MARMDSSIVRSSCGGVGTLSLVEGGTELVSITFSSLEFKLLLTRGCVDVYDLPEDVVRETSLEAWIDDVFSLFQDIVRGASLEVAEDPVSLRSAGAKRQEAAAASCCRGFGDSDAGLSQEGETIFG
ncbi:Hypothetical predicted protein [Olea europaea subsp. europaea]|uniref:Uncharacterized protein n=1 Tax=Olea europaea subsp. europaea TaxID=158383 RepID=A0A8S0UR45_OLEEU|nr:Hypothetical predicted protein [Olea europaea subsp. europaea]